MTKKHLRQSDGQYHIHGHKFDVLEGSRAQVWHNTAYHTPGGLTKSHLLMNKRGHIVSKRKHTTAKHEKRLIKAGYYTRKGSFGFIRKEVTRKCRQTKRHK